MKILSATIISIIAFSVYYAGSRAPSLAHVGVGLGLFIGFFVPAMFIRSRKQMVARKYFITVLVILGTAVTGAYKAEATIKIDFWHMFMFILPFGYAVLVLGLLAHVFFVEWIDGKIKKPNKAKHPTANRSAV